MPAPSDQRIGRSTVLYGADGGKYPDANALLVEGRDAALLIDPAVGLHGRPTLPRVDHVLNSHAHEDHVAGNGLFPDVPVYAHALDVAGIRSLDGLMAVYGMPPEIEAAFRPVVVERFRYAPRPDARALADGQVFELGGARVRVVHLPGHTRGHCGFFVEPDGALYVSDIDLSSFGPYYGDASSSLEDFERSLAAVADIEARWYVTSHHVGAVEGRAAFLERLARFGAKIVERERRLLAFLAEPRTLDDVVAHRFVYRPGDAVPFADAVERRSMAQHLERLARHGRVTEVEPGRWRAAA